MYKISVVVPVYNEEGNVEELHKEIKKVCEENHYEYEIIFINDGSSDQTDEICRGSRQPQRSSLQLLMGTDRMIRQIYRGCLTIWFKITMMWYPDGERTARTPL